VLERVTDEFRYPYLSPSELAGRLARKPVLYLPIGSLEWHNEHLPLGTDSFHAMVIAERLARQVGGVVLPPFWWNTGGCHDHASTFHMPESLYRAALMSVCLGLRPVPAKVLALINGHGGKYQYETPPLLAQELNAGGFPMRVLAADPYRPDPAATPQFRIDHANTGETSLAMELIPQLVRMDRKLGPDIMSGKMPFSPEKGPASAAMGKAMWDEMAVGLAKQIEAACAQAGK
jgi:creatinine amidohydrolase